MSYVIAEIRVNHNGDIDLAKELIDMAHTSGCDVCKIPKEKCGRGLLHRGIG